MRSRTGGLRCAPGKLTLVIPGVSLGWMSAGRTAEPSFDEVTAAGTDYAFEGRDPGATDPNRPGV